MLLIPGQGESVLRYPPEHKQETRARILDAAGRLFRKHGYDGVGIDRIMAEAGLTRGGFYVHFRSKADLFARVLAREGDFHARLKARRGAEPGTLAAEAMEVVAGYLHPDHRDRVGQGCFLASLSVDAARGSRPARRAFASPLRSLVREFARGLEDVSRPETDPRALRAVALSVGGLVLARACGDESLARALLAACRDGVAVELLGQGGEPDAATPDASEA